MIEITAEERLEAIRQVRAAGHMARPILLPNGEGYKSRNDAIEVRRLKKNRTPTSDWHQICVLFYDAWLDGQTVPTSLDDAMTQ